MRLLPLLALAAVALAAAPGPGAAKPKKARPAAAAPSPSREEAEAEVQRIHDTTDWDDPEASRRALERINAIMGAADPDFVPLDTSAPPRDAEPKIYDSPGGERLADELAALETWDGIEGEPATSEDLAGLRSLVLDLDHPDRGFPLDRLGELSGLQTLYLHGAARGAPVDLAPILEALHEAPLARLHLIGLGPRLPAAQRALLKQQLPRCKVLEVR